MKRIIISITTLSLLLAGCVKQNAQVVLQKIDINPDTITITVGETEQLIPIFTPSSFSSIAVEWKSTDTTIASFSTGGYLYAKKPGKIWVTVKDKNSATTGKAFIIIP